MGIGELDREAHVPEGTRGAAAPRTLAEALRARGDEGLAALLRARPDLLSPVPNDLTQLATRAGTRGSVVRALERLDRFTLQTAEALAVAPDPAPYPVLLALLTGDDGDPDIESALPRAVEVLREQALVWGEDERLRLVRTARELLAPSPQHPSPTGLGPTVSEATAGMSPGRIQEILAAAGLPATHDSVSAVAALTELFTDRDRMGALLDTAPSDALAVLDRLVWGPPYGEVTANPAPPVRWLRDRGLLLPASPRTVVLPREAALHLRGGRAHRSPEPHAPVLAVLREYRPQVVDNAAAGQAYTALATVEELLKGWDQGGPAVLRAGGMAVRDLRRTAAALDVTEQVAAFWLELAYGAGLLASDGEADERYAPTPAYDDWLDLPPAERWARLATSWLTGTRTPGLVGGQDAKGRALSALGPDLDRGAAPEVRRRVLTLQATLPPGVAADPETLLARLRWERPLRGTTAGTPGAPDAGSGTGSGTGTAPGGRGGAGTAGTTGTAGTAVGGAYGTGSGTGPGSGFGTGFGTGHGSAVGPGVGVAHGPADLRSRLALWTLAEAELLGITGRGALGSPARALLNLPLAEAAAEPVAEHGVELSVAASRAATLLGPLLPETVDHVLLQADLTAVAPGPLRRPLADMLSVLADVESKGGATVYRFTPGSVRRALDAGRSASDLQDFLTAHSRTPVPQPLSYLIDDVARKHGHLRIGAASAYVRCDDDALLGEILADKRSASLRLRRLAPTVLAAQTDPAALLDGLRSMGYAPAAESAAGDVLITRADTYRTGARTAPAPVPDGPPAPDRTLLGAAVRAIRAGDAAATAVRKERPESPEAPARAAGELPRTSSAETLATVQAAAMTGSAVWIGYVNAEGSASQRVIAPVRVEGGFVTGYDHTADEVRTYPLHRITGVAELADDQV
ncbi:helicase-associated domain-containing protein [Streptomyces sp. NPDC013457]|uniref:helicase-associated domain-containing protein n=1 Tax=Streptomyces sp. NPDC013457 TaxID=3364866 RepID=UPI0036FA1A46